MKKYKKLEIFIKELSTEILMALSGVETDGSESGDNFFDDFE